MAKRKIGCFSLQAGLALFIIAIFTILSGYSSMERANSSHAMGVVMMLFGGVIFIASLFFFVEAFDTKPPPVLFPTRENLATIVKEATTPEEKKVARRATAEAVQEARLLTPGDREVLEQVKINIKGAPKDDEVVGILEKKSAGTVVLANRKLQPIAFALKPMSGWHYAKGLAQGLLTWAGFTLSIPLVMLSVYIGLGGDIWRAEGGVYYRLLRYRRRAKRYRLRPYKNLIRNNSAPILYLRSFSDDYEESLEGFFPTTSEDKLVAFYNHYGPVLAIGQPKEKVPLLGASRIYFDDATWQAAILYLMTVSKLVVINAGIAVNLLWEIGSARQRLKLEPEKLVISFAAWTGLDEWTYEQHYARFKKFADELLECELPQTIDKATRSITFDPGWVPVARSQLIPPLQ